MHSISRSSFNANIDQLDPNPVKPDPRKTHCETETGGLYSLHKILDAPFRWTVKQIAITLSPELGRSTLRLTSEPKEPSNEEIPTTKAMSICDSLKDTIYSVAKLGLLIPLFVVTGTLSIVSLAARETVQLFVSSTITEFGRLDRVPGDWDYFDREFDQAGQDDRMSILERLEVIGSALCDYQARGPKVPEDNPELYSQLKNDPMQDANWAEFDKRKVTPDDANISEKSVQQKLDERIKDYVAYSQWSDLDTLIQSMKHLGINSYRTSPPESLFPDQEGIFNETAIARYKEILQKLNENGISFQFTGFHFTYPRYIDKSGGYLNEKNCDTYVKYMKKMFEEFHPYVHSWCTINEPAVFATQRYFRGVHAGGEINFQKMGKLMINLIKMHNRAYQEMKTLPGGKDAIIGFSHDVIDFKPHNEWNPIDQLLCTLMTHVMHKAYLDFYRSGTFELYLPVPSWVSWIANLFGANLSKGVHARYSDENFKENNGYLDRIFLQVYGRPELSFWHAVKTGQPYEHPDLYHPGWGCPADPYAVYTGIRHVYEVTGKDIEITETGTPFPNKLTPKLVYQANNVPVEIDEEENIIPKKAGRSLQFLTEVSVQATENVRTKNMMTLTPNRIKELSEKLKEETITFLKEQQATYIKRVFIALREAMKANFPVKGIYIWAFLGSKPYFDEESGEYRAPYWEWDEGTNFNFAILDKSRKEDGHYGMTPAAEVVRMVANRYLQNVQDGVA